MPTPPSFETLRSTDNPIRDVRRFLRGAGRLDTLKHAAQVNAVGRRLARRVWLPFSQTGESLRLRASGEEGELCAIDLACTAHDMAAVVPLRDIIATAEDLGVPLTDADRAIPQVIHGPLAATVLQQRLSVTDEDVLNAVRYHTTLRAGASALEQLVFIADKIALDPTARHTSFHPALSAALAKRPTASLAELCCIYLDWVARDGPGLGWKLHPHVLAAHAELKDTLPQRHGVVLCVSASLWPTGDA
ncbi:MAG: HD domain-containing protein [Anaerolineales bacterium]